MPQHREIIPGENHIPYDFEYADTAARTGASGLLPEDEGKLARQLDDDSIWELTNDSPVTWEPIGGGSASSPFVLASARNALATDIWLRTINGVPLNNSPFRISFDSKLIAIAATTQISATWDCEIYKNADVRAGGVPSDPNKIAELVLAATLGDEGFFSVDLNAGDELGVFCRGTNVARPHVSLYFVRR